MAYFDHSATTPVHKDVLSRMHEIQSRSFGNPSSNHKKGRQAKSIIEEARNQVSESIGAAPNQILFTSGGTESNNQVLFSIITLFSVGPINLKIPSPPPLYA